MSRPFVLLLAAGIAAAAAATLGAQGQEFACEYTRKLECSARGCQDVAVGADYLLVPGVDVLLDATLRATERDELPIVKRCDSRGCTAVPVRATLDSTFVNATALDGTYFLKISTVDRGDDGRIADFVEVAAQSLATVTYFGTCKGVVPASR